MVTKLLSLASAITIADIAARSHMDAGAPLYAFASTQIWVNVVLAVIVAITVAVSFKRKNRFKSWYTYAGCLALAALLIVTGCVGAFYSNFRLDGWSMLLPLDYVLMLECGVVLAISGLSYRHHKRPFSLAWAYSLGRLVPSPKAPALAAANGLRAAYRAARDAGAALSAGA